MREFHARSPGITAHAFGRGGSYARLASVVRSASRTRARVLDLACGDGSLLVHLDPDAIGIDLSHEELAAARVRVATAGVRPIDRVVQGRAQALPFADASFDACTCHLAFMLFDDVEHVVAELARVLVPGGLFLALLGGGPTAAGDDAFHRFLSILEHSAVAPIRLGDPRARSEEGWRTLFASWGPLAFERWEVDLGGTFDEVWAFVGASYEVPRAAEARIRAELRIATSGITDPAGRIPCTVVTWLARAIRPA